MNYSNRHTELQLQRIANILLLNASFIENLGLLDGKIGIAIFFYHYSRYTGNEVFEHYADELIDEIYSQICKSSPIDFKNGMMGIGWGLWYLAHKEFIEANLDETLSEIDDKIFYSYFESINTSNNEDSFLGLILYLVSRAKVNDIEGNLINLRKNQMIVQTMDECICLLTRNEFFGTKLSILTLSQLNLLLWFILQIHEIQIYTLKCNLLLNNVLSYVRTNKSIHYNVVEYKTCYKILKSYKQNRDIADNVLESICQWPEKNKIKYHLSDDCFYANYAQDSLFYELPLDNVFPDDIEIENEFFVNDCLLKEQLDSLDERVFGLNKGLAGLGLIILNNLGYKI